MNSLRTVCYILTAPWQTWKVAVHQILLMPEHSTDRVTIMNLWRKNRKTEYSTVTIVGTILASVAITSVNGTEAAASHWTVLAFWHGTLTCSIFAVLIAFYLGVFIDMCETCMEGVPNLLQAIRHERGHAHHCGRQDGGTKIRSQYSAYFIFASHLSLS
ncbi:hypothetical protein PMG11_05396 [Penicillium brasilianum]|uniref:Uncharacterized protein n=1 Tax=Penicillium brasilianum TaxID=104259 RepID=A0A0F7VFJ7_PENBI|nr:hypothetical protein PMG11_05396 [Penicillium brasilianum]